MRIALVTREFPPETAWGGIATFYDGFARELVKAGHEVEVFCQGLKAAETIGENGLTVHRVRVRRDVIAAGRDDPLGGNADIGVFSLELATAMLRAVSNRHRERPFDIIEGHEHLGINALINTVGLPGTRTVTRYHTAYHTLVRRHLVNWPESAVISWLEKLSIHAADARIASSTFIDQVTQGDFGAPPANALIPHFNEGTKSGTVNRSSKSEPLALFVGRMDFKVKRPDLAIAAFSKLAEQFPEWQLEIVGPDIETGDGASAWQVCRRQIPTKLADRIIYRGQLPREEVLDLYRRARLLLVPSAFESFGMVAIEAMRAGCVPIVADQTPLVDVVGDPGLSFPNGDAEALAERMRVLMASKERWEKISQRLRERAWSAFAPTCLLEQNTAFLAQLIDRPADRDRVTQTADLPGISVIIPSYNQGSYIGETIDSILDQGYPNLEVIVVDGGSSDQTLEVLRRYPQIRWVSERDKGQAHAINKGMLMAGGELLAYLNSDDLYRPGSLFRVAEIFRSEPQTKIIVGNCDYVDEQSNTLGTYRAKFVSLQDLICYWGWERLHCIPQQATFWRRSLIAEVGLFNASLQMVMDYEYWVRVGKVTHFRVVDETLAAFRLVQGTKTVTRTDEMYREEYEVFRRFRHLLPWPRRAWESLTARRHYAERLFAMSQHFALSLRMRRRPASLLLRALRLWPPYAISPTVILTAMHLLLSTIMPQHRIEPWHRRWLDRLYRTKRS